MKARWHRPLTVVVLSLATCLWASVAVAEEAKTAPAAETKTPASTKDVATFVVRNGGMTQGVTVPADWTGRFGDCTVSRDTAVFKEGPASLCVVVAGGKSGQAFQRIAGPGLPQHYGAQAVRRDRHPFDPVG
jgi:hypothetical protein